MGTKIADLLISRDNNFNLIRFVAAAAVIYSHSFTATVGNEHPWFVSGIKTSDFGYLAVNIFFILSGFLVMKSWIDKPDLIRFIVARGLRIVPAFVVVAVATAFIIGPVFSTVPLGSYLTDLQTWLYVPLTVIFVNDTVGLPGMFETVLDQGTLNAPLWTLKYEVASYAALTILGAVSVFATRTRGLTFLAVMGAGYLVIHLLFDWRDQVVFIDNIIRLWLCFFLGAAFYLLRDQIKLSVPVGAVLALVAALSYGTVLFELLGDIALAYGVIWFALVPGGKIRTFNRLGDYSYGLYIFAWPLQQIAVQMAPGLTPHSVFALVLPPVLLVAALSWHFVEKPCLSLRGKVVALVTGVLNPSNRLTWLWSSQ